jgi:hypothetical protein
MKKKTILLAILFVFSPFLITISSRSYEAFGTDLAINDPADDVWTVSYTAGGGGGYLFYSGSSFDSSAYSSQVTVSYVGKTSLYPFIDIIKLAIEDTGTNYKITLTLKADYNSTALTESSGNAIAFYFNANASTYVNATESPFWVTIGYGSANGHVACLTYKGYYAASAVSVISGKTVTWEFPKSSIDNLIDNIKPVAQWEATGTAVWYHATETAADYAVDFLSDQKSENQLAALSGGTVPGYPILILSGVFLGTTLVLLKKALKRKKID